MIPIDASRPRLGRSRWALALTLAATTSACRDWADLPVEGSPSGPGASGVRRTARADTDRGRRDSPYARVRASRHASRQQLARDFGATDIVTERGDEGVARIKELTDGIGADSVLECVGTQTSMMQAIRSARPGGYVSYVGVPHGVTLKADELFFTHVHLHGGPAPVRAYLEQAIPLVLDGTIDPGRVFDRTVTIDDVPAGYRAMDDREALKVLVAF